LIDKINGARLGEAWHGAAWLGEAWMMVYSIEKQYE